MCIRDRDSFFADYAAYADFVDSHIINRDFIELIQKLGGRDEYTIEQLRGINGRFLSIYPANFTGRAVTHETDLGRGFRQEMRVYWDGDGNYVFFYAALHERPDALVVLTFNINSDPAKVLEKF